MKSSCGSCAIVRKGAMELTVHEGKTVKIATVQAGETLLQALRNAGYSVAAPCGGNGTCGKCRVLVRDEQGLSYRLACQTEPSEGMEVTVESARAMEVSLAGTSTKWQVASDGQGYGVAIDVGTTTVVCCLCDLATGEVLAAAGRANPQLAFGADVLSRISAVADGALDSMRDLLGDALESTIKQLAKQAGVSLADIKSAVLAGNTTMQHIAISLDPTSIGVSPFTPLSLFGENVQLPALKKLKTACDSAYFAPCLAGYVGGDITCGMLAMDMGRAVDPMLFLDLGTNGEMALGCEQGIVTCATAAGPVFEGANIKYGMPAYPGAISHVAYENGKLALQVIGDCDPIGICGTGLIDAIALMLRFGLLDETGLILDEDEIDLDQTQGLEKHLCEEDGSAAFELAKGVVVTQRDVRTVQLAKAAIYAGMQTMLQEADCKIEQVASMAIAGGFGEYLNLESAACIGLIPEELLDCAKCVGNSCIEGAQAVLVSQQARDELAHICQLSDYIELSGHTLFNQLYVEAMGFDNAIA